MSRAQLKGLAVIAMLFDHIGYLFLNTGHSLLYSLFRGFGRIAFPLFCFMLVQGFKYTGNRWKYLARLLAFALISEIPFDLAFAGKWFEFGVQNVFFTLAVGLLFLMALERFREDEKERWLTNQISNGNRMSYRDRMSHRRQWSLPEPVLLALFVTVAFFLVQVLRSDYSFWGILMIWAFYEFQEKRRFWLLAAFFALICMGMSAWELPALFSLIFIWFYRPELAGGRTRLPKYFFYWFYPVHLLVLYGIHSFLG